MALTDNAEQFPDVITSIRRGFIASAGAPPAFGASTPIRSHTLFGGYSRLVEFVIARSPQRVPSIEKVPPSKMLPDW